MKIRLNLEDWREEVIQALPNEVESLSDYGLNYLAQRLRDDVECQLLNRDLDVRSSISQRVGMYVIFQEGTEMERAIFSESLARSVARLIKADESGLYRRGTALYI